MNSEYSCLRAHRLLHAIEIFKQANHWAVELLEDSSIKEAEDSTKAAIKAATTAEFLLGTLDDISEGEPGEAAEFLLDSTRRGQDVLVQLVETGCQQMVTLPRIATVLDRRWRGKLLDSVISGSVLPPFGDKLDLEDRRIRRRSYVFQNIFSIPNRLIGSYKMRFIFFIVVVLVNILVMPLVLLFPPLGGWIQTKLLPSLGVEKKGRWCFKHTVPWMLIFAGGGGGFASYRLSNRSLSIADGVDAPAALLIKTFSIILIALGVTALVAGPYRPHTVAAKRGYSGA